MSRTNASRRFLHFPFFALCSFIPGLVYFNPLPLYRPVLPKKGQTGLARTLLRLGIVLKGQACVARTKWHAIKVRVSR